MDVSNAPADQGVMIAFLPTTNHWSSLEVPHMTLVYAGTKDKLRQSDYNALVKATAEISWLTQPFELQKKSLEVFGDDSERVNVLTLRATEQLLALRAHVEKWNQSEHSFNPHVTLGSVSEYINPTPEYVFFNRVTCGWGTEYTTFKL